MAQKTTEAPYLFLIFWKAWRAVEAVDRGSIRELGLGCFSDFVVLEALLHKGAMPVKELGRKAGLTSGSITTAVQRLESKGWIRREKNPEDSRYSLISLTPEGTELIHNAFQEHARRLEQAFAPLPRSEREQFVRLLKKVGRTAEAMTL